MDNSHTIGDVVRNHWPVEYEKSVNLYVGTGRCGGCFDSYGLQHQDPRSASAKRACQTLLMHAEVCHRGRHGKDVLVPLGQLRWSTSPGEPEAYQQHLDISRGRLTTDFDTPDFSYHLETSGSPASEHRDLLFFHLRWHGKGRPNLVLQPPEAVILTCNGEMEPEWSCNVCHRGAAVNMRTGSARAEIQVRVTGDFQLAAGTKGIQIELAEESGEGTLVLAMGPHTRSGELSTQADRVSAMGRVKWAGRSAADWKERWGTSPSPSPEPKYASLARRSIYHILSSYAPDVRAPAPPMGLTGNGWGFHFPQDLSYIHPALLRLGHTDITKAHVEFYASHLEDQERLTREIYKKRGVCWSWEFPIDKGARLFAPEDGGAPNHFQYEIHNAAYPAKMAVDTANVLKRVQWTRDFAWPIVRASAIFFADCAAAETDGEYSIHVIPSMGQDEFGGEDAKNYLCALFAAEYTLKQGIRLAEELGADDAEVRTWRQILDAGFAYKRLLDPETGFYRSNEEVRFIPRTEKHPVQLNPLWLLPLGRVDEPTRCAYRLRRFICATERDGMRHPDVPTGYYDGWTLFAFMLSAAKIGDRPGFAHELNEMLPGRLVDPDLITLYESSGFWGAHFTTSMGLFLQSLFAAEDHGW